MKLNNNKGISLVEFLVSAGIFTIIMGGLTMALLAGNQSWLANDAAYNTQREARKAISAVARDLRIDDTPTITTATSSNVEFTVADSSGNVTYTWANSGSDANRLIRTTSAATRIIAQNISSLSITETGNYIEVDVTSSFQPSRGDTNSFQLQTRIAKLDERY